MNTKRTVCLFSWLFIIAFGSAFAMEGDPRVLNPKTYVSPSSTYSLTVDPTDLYGRGPAEYRCLKDGNVVWAHQLPYTLWNASVADSGRVVGYAYTHGWSGLSEAAGSDGAGEFIMSLLSPDGILLNEERHSRERSRVIGGMPPIPVAIDMIQEASTQRLLLRVADPDVGRETEQWWIYDLESLRRVRILDPARLMPQEKGNVLRAILGVTAVPRTPLVLTHWWTSASGSQGGVFSLVDLSVDNPQPVWTLVLDGDYSVPGNEEVEDVIRKRVYRDGAILDAEKPFSFAILAVKQHQRITFNVQMAENGRWTICETARTPHDFASSKPSEELQAFPRIQLNEVAVVQLSGLPTRTASKICEVRGFAFDAEGRICVCSAADDKEPHLLQITDKGDIIKNLRVPVDALPPNVEYAGPAHVGDAKFVVTVSDGGMGGRARCFMADFRTEAVTELSDFHCPPVTALVGFPDGRFAALIDDTYAASRYGISLFDVEGHLVWQKRESGFPRKPEELCTPCDITRYDDMSIAILDENRHSIQLFDVNGVFLRQIDLHQTGKREQWYPEYIQRDSQGGFAVYYVGIDSPCALVRTDAEGRIKNEYRPRFSDGRPVSVDCGVRQAPDGRLWVTDGDVLLRLSDDGTVDRILGEEAIAVIRRPSYAVVGPNDLVYVADGRNCTVHAFDGDGNAKGISVPGPNDLAEYSYVRHIAATVDGDTFVSLEFGYETTYVHFDANRKRVGSLNVDLMSVSQDWYFQPEGPLCWIVGDEDVFLVKDLQNVVRKISRRADGMWLERPSTLGVAPDGSIAVLAESQSGEVSLNTYGPDGNPRATYVGPPEWSDHRHVAYDGQDAYVRSNNDVYVIGPDNGRIGFFQLPVDGDENAWEGPFLAAEGKQLWFIDLQRLMLYRFAVWLK